MPMDTEPRPAHEIEKAKKKLSPLGLLGAGVGGAFGWYCGLYLLIPLIGWALIAWLLKKASVGPEPANYRNAWALQADQMLWMSYGAIYLGKWGLVAPDDVALVIGLVWFWLKPGLAPIIWLGLYQVLAGAVNVFVLAHHLHDLAFTKPLAAHLGLRAGALALMILGYVQQRKLRSLPPLPPTAL
jgi:hypothetical protein